MKQFYKDFGFVIGFMIMTLIIQASFGEKVEKYFLLITLLSMLLVNSDKFISFLQNNFMKTGTGTVKENGGSTTHTSSSGQTHGGSGGTFVSNSGGSF